MELGKLYRILPDKDAQTHGLVRIIDRAVRIMPIQSIAFIQ